MQGRVYALCDPFRYVIFRGRHKKIGVNSKEVLGGKAGLQSFYKRGFPLALRGKQNYISLVFCMGKKFALFSSPIAKRGIRRDNTQGKWIGHIRSSCYFQLLIMNN